MAFTHQAVLLILAAVGMQRVNLGRFEEYGEVISGGFIALIGLLFLVWPLGGQSSL